MAARPITRADFAKLMAPLGPFPAAPFFALAVSGGPDSLALALLLKDWLAKRKSRLLALVVDHGLRAESGKESLSVVRQLKTLGIEAKRLTWRGEKPTSGIQEAARQARYELLTKACRKAGCLYLFLGHHLDDQIETLQMRLVSGSGAEGLAGIPLIAAHPDLLVLRPLLPVAKARLLATLGQRQLAFVEDPSNRDRRFARARLREGPKRSRDKVAFLAKQKLSADLRATIEALVAHALALAAEVQREGYVWLKRSFLDRLGETAPLFLRELLRALGGHGRAPSLASVSELWESLPHQKARTLAGCRVLLKEERLLLVREESHSLPAPWRPLTQKGWNYLVGRAENPGLPGPVLFALPSLWRGGKPIAVPHLGVGRQRAPNWRPWPPLGGLGAKVGAGRIGGLPAYASKAD